MGRQTSCFRPELLIEKYTNPKSILGRCVDNEMRTNGNAKKRRHECSYLPWLAARNSSPFALSREAPHRRAPSRSLGP